MITVDLPVGGKRERAGLCPASWLVAAVAGRVPVLVDGGMRRGVDILKDDLVRSMQLSGVSKIAEITQELIFKTH